MKIRKIRKKDKIYERNCCELRKLSVDLGLEVWEFQRTHLRIVGKQLVDFWPSTGKAWVVGSHGRGKLMSVAEVCDLALDDSEILPEGAKEHMDSMVAA